MKAIWKNDRGSVSIYFILIVSAMFLFVSVLIDFARVKLAERESELAVKSGLRSVFSAYDVNLREYGLFGVALSQQQEQQMLREAAGNNLSSSAGSPFSLISVKLDEDSVRIRDLHHLGNRMVFERQVLEDMKYKAPAEYAKTIAETFGKSREMVQSANDFMEEGTKLEELVEKREEQLGASFELSERLSKDMIVALTNCKSVLDRLSTLNAALRGMSRQGLLQELQSVLQWDAETEEEQAQKQDQINRIESQLSLFNERQSLADGLENRVVQDFSAFSQQDGRIYENLAQARETDISVQREINGMKAQSQASQHKSAYDVVNQVEVLGDSYFSKYKSDIAANLSTYGIVVQMTAKHMELESPAQVDRACADGIIFIQSWLQQKTNEMQVRQSRIEHLEQQKKEQESKARKTIDDVKEKMGLTACGPSDAQWYEKLEGKNGLRAYYESTDDATNENSANPPDIDETPASFGKQSVGFLNGLLNEASVLRNTMLINEYVLSHFNDRTYVHPNGGSNIDLNAGHMLQGQEAEYVLYGFSSCEANLAAAYGEMYAARLAIRTMEALTDPKKVAEGSPLLVMATAVAEGALKAYEDMNQLIQGKQVELSAKIPKLQTSYTDYVRLFLLQSGNQHKLSRLMALIQLNTGIDLKHISAYAQADAATSVRLWFIPAVIRSLKAVDAVDGNVKGNDYEIHAKAAYSYS